jgi:hypothetical protein
MPTGWRPKNRHLTQRGDDHPRSRAVITPAGRFGSAALAAKHYGVTRQHAARLAREGREWRYETAEEVSG